MNCIKQINQRHVKTKQYEITFDLSAKGPWTEGVKGKTTLEALNDRTAFATASGLYEGAEWEIKPIRETCELVKELATREGVQHIEVEPHVPIKVEVDGKSVGEIKSGPCHIFVVYD